jgi:UDP-N-acetyl-D-glucosamine dehydrogenase
MQNDHRNLEDLIRDRAAHVGVIGLGYVGLPLVHAFVRAGFEVTGFDIDAAKTATLERGDSYIKTVGAAEVREMIATGRFRVTTEFRGLRKVHAVIICVPTPLTKAREPDLSYIVDTGAEIRKYLERGQLVVLESTTYPGTTEEVLRPLLEESGLTAGEDFFLAFSPEREDPGNKSYNTRTIPKLVGGVDAASGRLASMLYGAAVERVIEVSHAKIAEAAKVLENIYRAVNIALINELKVLFDRMGIDVWEVIDAAKTKPFGFQAFYPGPGLGGHCVPIDPFYLTWKAREYGLTTRFIELAGEINTAMPHYVVEKVAATLNRFKKTVNGSRGLIVGVAYKPNTDDVRESPALRIIQLLQDLGASLCYHDPYVPVLRRTRLYQGSVEGVALTPEVLAQSDFTLVVTDHDAIDWSFVVEHSNVVIDTRNATRAVTAGREKIVKA